MKLISIVLGLLVFVGGGYYAYQSFKPGVKFNLTSERIAKDLEGRTAPLLYGQVWPFDPTQNLVASVVGKKTVDDYVVLFVNLKANANVTTEKEKEKLPTQIALSGIGKLTYENVGSEWYLINVESVSLKATPVELK